MGAVGYVEQMGERRYEAQERSFVILGLCWEAQGDESRPEIYKFGNSEAKS
jgi:hypothetical protein